DGTLAARGRTGYGTLAARSRTGCVRVRFVRLHDRRKCFQGLALRRKARGVLRGQPRQLRASCM
ncbi:MAG TPA: hypothetical protein PK867_23625, partial [Pirellulales bacterium]|nr:hypothetical protein [Pirellulales bacterium]